MSPVGTEGEKAGSALLSAFLRRGMGVGAGVRGGEDDAIPPAAPPTSSPAPPGCSRCRWRCSVASRTDPTSSSWGSCRGRSATAGRRPTQCPPAPGAPGTPTHPPHRPPPGAPAARAPKQRTVHFLREPTQFTDKGKQAQRGQRAPLRSHSRSGPGILGKGGRGPERGAGQPLWAGAGGEARSSEWQPPGITGPAAGGRRGESRHSHPGPAPLQPCRGRL